MLKQIYTLLAHLVILPLGSFAQDASDIAKVSQGNSCPSCNLFQADLACTGIRNIEITGSRPCQANVSLSTMDGVNFSGTDLKTARSLTNAQLAAACGAQSTYLPSGMHLPHCL